MAQPATPARRGHDSFISKIVKDPQQPPDALVLSGYLGASSEPGHTRLYFDLQLSNFVEIPDDAILHVEDTAKEGEPLGASYVWINRDATLVHGRPGPERVRAKFLEGPIALGAAAQGVMPIPPPTVGPPCNVTLLAAVCPPPSLLAAACPSVVCTHLPACPTSHAPCPTHQITPCAPCPTHQITPCAPCPTHQITPCAPCPTHQITACTPCLTPGHPQCPPPTPFCPTPDNPVCPPLTPACPTHVLQPCPPPPTPACPTLHHPLCPPTPACPTHVPQLCPSIVLQQCPPPHTPLCPVQTGVCPVQTALCPIHTLACPIQTAVCPIPTGICPPQTAGCPIGGGGGFNPGD